MFIFFAKFVCIFYQFSHQRFFIKKRKQKLTRKHNNNNYGSNKFIYFCEARAAAVFTAAINKISEYSFTQNVYMDKNSWVCMYVLLYVCMCKRTSCFLVLDSLSIHSTTRFFFTDTLLWQIALLSSTFRVKFKCWTDWKTWTFRELCRKSTHCILFRIFELRLVRIQIEMPYTPTFVVI